MVSMTYYGAKEIASSSRTVRNNTIQIAEDIPEDQYGFQAAPGVRTVRQLLIHVSNIPKFAFFLHRDHADAKNVEGLDFMSFVNPIMASEQEPHTKAQILQALRESGDEFVNFVSGLSDDFLGEVVTMMAGGTPPARSRFDMLISIKEHEMHHRGQLMLIERLLGITPHLTRQMEERIASMQAAAQAGR